MAQPSKSKTRVAAHQPNFLPWAGFWNKLISADIFVLCAGMQYVKRGYANRVRMRDNGNWASIPVNGGPVPCASVRIARPDAVAQVGRRIRHWSERRDHPYGERLNPIIDRLLQNDDDLIYRLNIDLIQLTLDVLGHSGTTLVVDTEERSVISRSETVAEIASRYGDTYLSGPSGPDYLERSELKGIRKVLVQHLVPDLGPETVLHLIASEANPLACLRAIGTWKVWD